MIRISTALGLICGGNQFLQFGLNQRLLNLAQVASFIRPLIEARTKKQIRESSLVMALSRYQRNLPSKAYAPKAFQIERLTVQPGLALISLVRSEAAHAQSVKLYNRVQQDGGFLTITEGGEEITIIFEAGYRSAAKSLYSLPLVMQDDDLAALRIKFSKKYLTKPGFLFAVLQALAFQNINLVEVASSATEFILYVSNKDVGLAFDTLFNQFRPKHAS